MAPVAASRELGVPGILRPWLSLLRWLRPVLVVVVEARWKACAALEGDRGWAPLCHRRHRNSGSSSERESFTVIKVWRRFFLFDFGLVLNYCYCFPIFIWYRRCLFVFFVLVLVFVRCA